MRTMLIVAMTVVMGCGVAAQAQEGIPQQVQPVDVYIRSARIALQTSDYKRAMVNLYAARDHYPQNFEVHFLLGSIFADRDDVDSMLIEWDLAKEYATEKQWDRFSNQVAKIKEQKWLERFNRAVQLVNVSDTAEERVRQASDPMDVDSLQHRVDEARRLAKEALRHCVMLWPEDFRAFSTRGLIYQREGAADSSLNDFVTAESLFHRYEFVDSTTNWYDTTAFFSGPKGEQTQKYKDYEKRFKKLSDEKRTRYRNLLVALIGAYYDAGDWDKTIAVARRYYQLDPDDINNIVTMADVFSRLDLEDEAFKWQEAVVRRDPGSKDTWYNMGIFYYNNAVRLQDSVTKYERLLQEKSNVPESKSQYDTYVGKRLENFKNAIPRFDKVVELDPKDDDTWRLLGICRFSLASLTSDLATSGEASLVSSVFEDHAPNPDDLWASAEETLKEAANRFPDDQNLCYMMKVTLAQRGNMEALNQWREKCP
jgi:tetratricopeptide (TPR) repeat protein